MRKTNKPGPKSRKPQQQHSRKATADLGEADTTSDDTDVDATDNLEDFRSPERDEDDTDYNLDFTTGGMVPGRCSTFRAAAKPQKPQQQRRSASRPQNASTTTPTRPTAAPSTSKSQPKPKPNRRKQKTPMQRDKLFWKEVGKLQATTHNLIPRLPFSRLVRELMYNAIPPGERYSISTAALEALQTSSEMYLTQRLQDAYLLTLHRGRITLTVKDMEMINFLRSQNN